MKELLIFAGTTEGRKLSECLAKSGIAHTVCVATEYGEIVLKEHPLVTVHCGRLCREEITEWILEDRFLAVIDATHPYAEIITENIRAALQEVNCPERGGFKEDRPVLSVPYLRLKRETDTALSAERLVRFETTEECAKALEKTQGNILLTTGSKELAAYCHSRQVRSRIYVRVLPGMESLSLCMEQGILGKQILAMQGPFTVEMNEAILRQYHISCLVTKESGISGGFSEKLEAAKRVGIPVFVVGRPKEKEGYSFSEICSEIERICGQPVRKSGWMEIVLAGIGMGSPKNLTREVQEAIEDADILLGAQRLLLSYTPKDEKRPFYQADQIVPYLMERQEKSLWYEKKKVVILFSGDSGFYSGCRSVYDALYKEIQAGRLKAEVRILPGISSVSYLAACIGESYQDAAVYSIHGKEICNLVRKIKEESKTFLLLSGAKDMKNLGRLLSENGMSECEVIAGYRLSYPEQQIKRLTPEECSMVEEEGLYTCLIQNPHAKSRGLAHGRPDKEFIRGRVPMTKEEIREISICKLKLRKEAVVYDIGSGTGSIAVEAAGLSDTLRVYAIEKKEEAVSLIRNNQEKFGLENIFIKEGEAPEAFLDLPVPTHAFIGGSGGRLREILSELYRRNPNMRIVMNAVSLETVCEFREILSLGQNCCQREGNRPDGCMRIKDVELVQIQVSRAGKTGNYHLMQAENPVWICAFSFCER